MMTTEDMEMAQISPRPAATTITTTTGHVNESQLREEGAERGADGAGAGAGRGDKIKNFADADADADPAFEDVDLRDPPVGAGTGGRQGSLYARVRGGVGLSRSRMRVGV